MYGHQMSIPDENNEISQPGFQEGYDLALTCINHIWSMMLCVRQPGEQGIFCQPDSRQAAAFTSSPVKMYYNENADLAGDPTHAQAGCRTCNLIGNQMRMRACCPIIRGHDCHVDL